MLDCPFPGPLRLLWVVLLWCFGNSSGLCLGYMWQNKNPGNSPRCCFLGTIDLCCQPSSWLSEPYYVCFVYNVQGFWFYLALMFEKSISTFLQWKLIAFSLNKMLLMCRFFIYVLNYLNALALYTNVNLFTNFRFLCGCAGVCVYVGMLMRNQIQISDKMICCCPKTVGFILKMYFILIISALTSQLFK